MDHNSRGRVTVFRLVVLLDFCFLLVGVLGLSNPCAVVIKSLSTVQS
jgi:hypothetical protein